MSLLFTGCNEFETGLVKNAIEKSAHYICTWQCLVYKFTLPCMPHVRCIINCGPTTVPKYPSAILWYKDILMYIKRISLIINNIIFEYFNLLILQKLAVLQVLYIYHLQKGERVSVWVESDERQGHSQPIDL